MVFFFCALLFGSGLSPFTMKAREVRAASGRNLRRETAPGPLMKPSCEGERLEPKPRKKGLKTGEYAYALYPSFVGVGKWRCSVHHCVIEGKNSLWTLEEKSAAGFGRGHVVG